MGQSMGQVCSNRCGQCHTGLCDNTLTVDVMELDALEGQQLDTGLVPQVSVLPPLLRMRPEDEPLAAATATAVAAMAVATGNAAAAGPIGQGLKPAVLGPKKQGPMDANKAPTPPTNAFRGAPGLISRSPSPIVGRTQSPAVGTAGRSRSRGDMPSPMDGAWGGPPATMEEPAMALPSSMAAPWCVSNGLRVSPAVLAPQADWQPRDGARGKACAADLPAVEELKNLQPRSLSRDEHGSRSVGSHVVAPANSAAHNTVTAAMVAASRGVDAPALQPRMLSRPTPKTDSAAQESWMEEAGDGEESPHSAFRAAEQDPELLEAPAVQQEEREDVYVYQP